ncbi:MAG: hypothetical protein MRY76_12825 [Pseudomonadales bacterium]|nr:hypothetical protein [Pseudomonadales bacterium]
MLTATTIKPRQLSLILPFLAALLCALLLNLGSSGNIRQGGDDEGSGLGGTGRLPVPGSESGLGGTGLKPFLGSRSETADTAPIEVEVFYAPESRKLALTQALELDIPVSREVEFAPLESPVQIAAASSFSRDSAAIDINEQIQRDLDSNALAFLQLKNELVAGHSSADLEAATDQQSETGAVINEASHSPAVATETDLAWQAVASFFSQNSDEDQDNGVAGLETGSDRIERPDRVQRPELPPMQRIRPSVQRAGILPPRVKPLRL